MSSDGIEAGDDIIIYERMYYPTLRSLGEEDYSRKERVPIEAVFAYIEAKHTLILEGKGAGSFAKALDQAAAVKSLCEKREPYPHSRISRNVNLLPPLVAQVREGWPDKQNPVYSAIIARFVRLSDKFREIEQDPQKIYDCFLANRFDSEKAPDLIVAGNSVVGVPVLQKTEGIRALQTPFSFSARPDFSVTVQIRGKKVRQCLRAESGTGVLRRISPPAPIGCSTSE